MMKMIWSRLAFAAILAGVSLPVMAQANRQQEPSARDQQVQKIAAAELREKEKFRGVSASVEDGIVTLTGTVELFIDKENAEKRVRKVKNVDGVRNHIQISGKEVTDAELRETLANKLRYDRVGYGIVFNNLTVGVENGAVTIGGKVRDYPDRSSAIAIVETTPGVKDVTDEIDVAPVSNFDDELRVRLARAIYGHSGLQKYRLDPQAPIRIVVENGNVELAGVVLNELDRQIVYIQANSVPGVFSVKNKLMVASDVPE
ncbi:MAG TPA: BON domain-containing protein [Candidatus Polarisedimenticolia bacterium]|nr:BON domain-containing protein [Candidatus Polarisedimenticolia bacterium]